MLAAAPRLLALLVEPNEPGNLGAIIRTADAAGADAVIVDGGADPYNGKAVRASAGSLFHLPVVPCAAEDFLPGAARAGLLALAATGHGEVSLDELIEDDTLARPALWLFGSEAHGLPNSVLEAADHRVRIPLYGRAESLNLAAAAAVALYASARAHRVRSGKQAELGITSAPSRTLRRALASAESAGGTYLEVPLHDLHTRREGPHRCVHPLVPVCSG